MRHRRFRRELTAALAAILLPACSGGGDASVRTPGCLERPTDLTVCLDYLRESLDDPSLPARLDALAERHPDHWIPRYMIADRNYRARRYGAAERGYLDALAVARAAGDRSGEARCHYAWASVGRRTAGLEESIRRHEETLDRYGDVEDTTVIAWSLKRLADRWFDLARYDVELEVRERHLAFLAAHPDPWEERGAIYMRARSQAALGDYRGAMEDYRRVLELAEAAGDDARTTNAAAALGMLLVDAGRFDEARASLTRSVAAARRDGDPEKIHFHRVMATLPDLRDGAYARARETLADLLPATRARHAERSWGHWRRETYFNNVVYLAEAELGVGRLEAAEALYDEADRLAPTVVAEVPRLDALTGRTRLLRARGDLDGAVAVAHRADDLVESMRRDIDPAERLRFLHKRADVLQSLVAVLAERSPGDLSEAFTALERGHARALRESLEFGRETVGPDVSLGDALARVGADELLVAFLLGEHESTLIVVGPEGATSHRLPPRRAIEAAADAWIDVLRRPLTTVDARLDPSGDLAAHVAVGRTLRRELFGHIESRIADARHLWVVADRGLHRLPLESLPEPDAGAFPFLGLRRSVTYLPSVAFLPAGDGAVRPRRPLLVANRRGDTVLDLAPLDGAEDEVRSVAALWDAAVLVDADGAALDDALEDRPDLLHLAAHAVLDPRRGPRVLLGATDDDGTLDAEAIVAWATAPAVVVLSACETARGEAVGGEGVLGLTRAFALAGTRRVVASLWSVDDARTAVFMDALHRELATEAPVAEALLAARRACVEAGSSHPFHWAPFVVYGTDAPQ